MDQIIAMATKKPSVSVVMSVYNGAEFLHSAIESILGQTFRDFEFIIIDDGSTDESSQIIKSYEDERINLITQSNHGLVYSLNKGIGLANGEYIARMDADDISVPTRFEKQIAVAKKIKADLIGCSFVYLDQYNRPLIAQAVDPHDRNLKRALYAGNPFAHGSTLIKREAITSVGGYSDDVGPAEDYDLWLRLAPNHTFAAPKEILYKWRMNPGGISYTSSASQVACANNLRLSYARSHPMAALAIKESAVHYRRLKRSHDTIDKTLASQLAAEQWLLLHLPQPLSSRVKGTAAFIVMTPDSLFTLKRISKDRLRPLYHKFRKLIKILLGKAT